jgi:1,4-dihydroxy-2-naphthoate octaprenyltransferase
LIGLESNYQQHKPCARKVKKNVHLKYIIMEDNETKESIFSKALNETKKKGFRQALTVFFCCVIIGLVLGFIFAAVQLGVTIGIGLGIVWMGVAYFNQKEE